MAKGAEKINIAQEPGEASVAVTQNEINEADESKTVGGKSRQKG